jgi:hypothetical protein
MSHKNNELTNILRVQGVKSKGYGLVPKIVMQDRRLHRNAKVIYAYFCSYAGAGDTAFPSVKKICYDLGFGSDGETFRKYINQLIKYDYVRVEQKRGDSGKFSNNIYTLVDKPDPKDDDRSTVPENEGGGDKSHEINISSVPENEGYGKGQPPTSIGTNNNNNNNNNNIYKNNNNVDPVVVKKYKEKIDKTTGGNISIHSVKKLLINCGSEKVDKYIELFPVFMHNQDMNNTVGFFIKACLYEYEPPKKSNKKNSFNDFEQHKYVKDEMENWFEDLGQ